MGQLASSRLQKKNMISGQCDSVVPGNGHLLHQVPSSSAVAVHGAPQDADACGSQLAECESEFVVKRKRRQQQHQQVHAHAVCTIRTGGSPLLLRVHALVVSRHRPPLCSQLSVGTLSAPVLQQHSLPCCCHAHYP